MPLPQKILDLLRPRDITDAQPIQGQTFLSPLPQGQINNEDSQMLMQLLGGLGRGGAGEGLPSLVTRGIGPGLRKLLEREHQVNRAVRAAPVNPNPVRIDDIMPQGAGMRPPIDFRNMPLLNKGKLFQQ